MREGPGYGGSGSAVSGFARSNSHLDTVIGMPERLPGLPKEARAHACTHPPARPKTPARMGGAHASVSTWTNDAVDRMPAGRGAQSHGPCWAGQAAAPVTVGPQTLTTFELATVVFAVRRLFARATSVATAQVAVLAQSPAVAKAPASAAFCIWRRSVKRSPRSTASVA